MGVEGLQVRSAHLLLIPYLAIAEALWAVPVVAFKISPPLNQNRPKISLLAAGMVVGLVYPAPIWAHPPNLPPRIEGSGRMVISEFEKTHAHPNLDVAIDNHSGGQKPYFYGADGASEPYHNAGGVR